MLNRPLVVSRPKIRERLNPGALSMFIKDVLYMTRTAILVDGGFYRKRAAHLWGKKTAEERAKELNAYCKAHLHDKDGQETRQ